MEDDECVCILSVCACEGHDPGLYRVVVIFAWMLGALGDKHCLRKMLVVELFVFLFFVHAMGTGNGTGTTWSILLIVFPLFQVSSVSGMQARTRLERTCNCRAGSYLII